MWDVIVLIPDHCLSIYFSLLVELFTINISKRCILVTCVYESELSRLIHDKVWEMLTPCWNEPYDILATGCKFFFSLILILILMTNFSEPALQLWSNEMFVFTAAMRFFSRRIRCPSL